MNTYALCPCCSHKLIHHISNHRDYWFCRRCWQEMPVIEERKIIKEVKQVNNYQPIPAQSLADFIKPKQVNLTYS